MTFPHFLVMCSTTIFINKEDAEDTLAHVMNNFAEFLPLIQGAFPVSNKTGLGIDDLKNSLISCAQQQLAKMQVPSSYEALALILEQNSASGNSLINEEKVTELARHCELIENDQIFNALEFLHQAGLVVLVSNQSHDGLEEEQRRKFLVVPDPQVSTINANC